MIRAGGRKSRAAREDDRQKDQQDQDYSIYGAFTLTRRVIRHHTDL